MRLGKRTLFIASALILLIMTGSCSSKPFLIVHYQLPETSDALAGKDISLRVSDIRGDKAFLSGSAQKSLRKFNDTFSLVVQQADGSGNLLGIYEIDALLTEVFKKKLKNMGLQVTSPADQAEYGLEIKLKEFKLDLVDRKWIINMNYQAGLVKNRNLRAMESISGSAERMKVISESDAEKVLGELLTDMVNKLDLAKLFQQARR